MPYDTETIVEPKCPKCGGKLWDNRETKKNPKAPDYKCKDAQCDGVIWPPKNGAPAPRAAAPAVRPVATSGKEPYSIGGPLPGVDNVETGAPPKAAPSVARLDSLFSVYSVCLDHAIAVEVPKLIKADIGADPETAHAIASTLFIAATRT